MPGLLSPQELVLLEEDTHYLEANIPIWGSRVISWATMIILIYHTKDIGYIVSDISDLPSTTIDSLMQQSTVNGMWYYLPQSTQDVIAEDAEAIVHAGVTAGKGISQIGQDVASSLGNIVANAIKPLADVLMIPLIIGIAIGLIYLTKKG